MSTLDAQAPRGEPEKILEWARGKGAIVEGMAQTLSAGGRLTLAQALSSLQMAENSSQRLRANFDSRHPLPAQSVGRGRPTNSPVAPAAALVASATPAVPSPATPLQTKSVRETAPETVSESSAESLVALARSVGLKGFGREQPATAQGTAPANGTKGNEADDLRALAQSVGLAGFGRRS